MPQHALRLQYLTHTNGFTVLYTQSVCYNVCNCVSSQSLLFHIHSRSFQQLHKVM